MSKELTDILSNLNSDIDQETLLLYLQGKLSPEQQHELEKKMLDNDFNLDALQGLESITDKHSISELVNELNKELKKKTERKRKFRQKLQLKQDPWILILAAIILILIVISYIIIHRQIHR